MIASLSAPLWNKLARIRVTEPVLTRARDVTHWWKSPSKIGLNNCGIMNMPCMILMTGVDG